MHDCKLKIFIYEYVLFFACGLIISTNHISLRRIITMLKQNSSTSSSKSSTSKSGSASGSSKSSSASATRANTAKSQASNSVNSGVTCSVTNCSHYCSSGRCNADNIKVTSVAPSYGGNPVSADTKKDTCCGTFRACK